jgi:hypothetical protein
MKHFQGVHCSSSSLLITFKIQLFTFPPATAMTQFIRSTFNFRYANENCEISLKFSPFEGEQRRLKINPSCRNGNRFTGKSHSVHPEGGGKFIVQSEERILVCDLR